MVRPTSAPADLPAFLGRLSRRWRTGFAALALEAVAPSPQKPRAEAVFG